MYDPLIGEIAIKLSDYASLEIIKQSAPTLQRILKQNVYKLVIKEEQSFKIDPLLVQKQASIFDHQRISDEINNGKSNASYACERRRL